MLVLNRKANQKIIIGDNITVVIVAVSGDRVKLGLCAPKNVPIHREEVQPHSIRRLPHPGEEQ